jgi:hypothetical protein
MSARRRAGHVAVALTLLAILFTWNALFDRAIGGAVRRYLQLQGTRVAENGPFVYVQDVMRPAAREGAIRATAWCVPIAAVGFVVVRWSRRAPADPGRPR